MSDRLSAGFEMILGGENMRADADPPILLPPNEYLLSETIRRAYADCVHVSVLGGETAHVPGPAADGVVVSTSAIRARIEPSPEDFVVKVGSGVTPEAAETAVEKAGLVFPLDMGSSSSATVGGAFMTNARSAVERGYGAFRDTVIGVRCISAGGAVITGGGRTAKNVTGYDLPRFFAGTMGLFGIAFELTIKAQPQPESRRAVVARFPGGASAAAAVSDLLAIRGMPSFFDVRAPEGLGGVVTISLGFDGLAGVVDRSTGDACNRAESAGAAS
ncbi:MAG: FAD-binding oxidoreductase, partial [Candidatus Latescibacteria bacterium]|nr:FAD-binding oxidoreductase [Candidatus Latescibacterota bacterium]